ncbi:uncharacterized protein Mppe [Anabrus simplex]|uniref:uncharacterized protein Mppe n=1 Tax=Anabrus simplex TaxID=316456 RepID=UPI0035A2A1FF
MLKKHRTRARIVVLLLGTVVFYNEFLSYTFQSWFKWPSVSCDACVRILLVADPQIIGERYENLGPLARWDCDRYLTKTFRRAVSHADPHVVAFLGDIMDEGSIATKEEYKRYLDRFYNIFYVPLGIEVLYLPGDNDIGGEDDQITPEKLRRYEQSFRQTSSLSLKQVDIYQINRLTYSIPLVIDNRTHFLENRTRVVLSHLPLLFLPNQYVNKVVKVLRPHVIFSAHDHKSLHTSVESDIFNKDQVFQTLMPENGPWWHFQLGRGIIHEVMVPTCSYRMGVPDMGYGVAVIDSASQRLAYTVLWLPSRFNQFAIYVGVLFVLCFFMLLLAICCLRRFLCPPTRNCFV